MVSKSELMEAARLVLENAHHGIDHNISLRQLSQAGYDENAILEIMESSIQMESAISKTSAKKQLNSQEEKEKFEQEIIQEIQEGTQVQLNSAVQNFQKVPATIKGFDVLGLHVSGANEEFVEEVYSQDLDAKELFGESFEKGPEKPLTYLELNEIEATKIEAANKHRPKFFEEKQIEAIYEAEANSLHYREKIQELALLIKEDKHSPTKKLVSKTLQKFSTSQKIIQENPVKFHGHSSTGKAKERLDRLRKKLRR